MRQKIRQLMFLEHHLKTKQKMTRGKNSIPETLSGRKLRIFLVSSEVVNQQLRAGASLKTRFNYHDKGINSNLFFNGHGLPHNRSGKLNRIKKII